MHDGPVYLLKYLPFIISKINILGGNIKFVVRSAVRPISDLFGKEEPTLGLAYTSNSAYEQ